MRTARLATVHGRAHVCVGGWWWVLTPLSTHPPRYSPPCTHPAEHMHTPSTHPLGTHPLEYSPLPPQLNILAPPPVHPRKGPGTRHTPSPPVDRHTPVKTLPSCNFFGGNNFVNCTCVRICRKQRYPWIEFQTFSWSMAGWVQKTFLCTSCRSRGKLVALLVAR